MRLAFFIMGCIMASVASLPAAEWHVAPEGNDSNPGTKERPVQTPGRAQALARERIAEGLDEDVTVRFHGGRYALTEPLRFGPADSGTARHAVTYAAIDGEPVSLSGGRVISGWTPADNGLWTASVPEVRQGEWYFRELFVNGRRAVRARSPFVRLVKTKPDKASDTFSVTLPEGTLGNWKAVEDIEIIILGDWEIFRKRLARIDVEHETVVLAPPDIAYVAIFFPFGIPVVERLYSSISFT